MFIMLIVFILFMGNFIRISRKAGKAIFDFNMINDGDKILVCFSGGKDSFTLIRVLKYLQSRYETKFEFKVFCVNPGFDFSMTSDVSKIMDDEGIDYEIFDSQISFILGEQLKIKKFRPCFLCSRMRRGIIYNYALKNGFNKVALGHNLDDAIETQLMNMFFGSKISLLKPMFLAENGKVEVIRPLIYVDSSMIVDFVLEVGFKPVENVCPLRAEDSKRDYFRKIIADLKENNPQIMQNCLHSFFNVKELNSWNIKERE